MHVAERNGFDDYPHRVVDRVSSNSDARINQPPISQTILLTLAIASFVFGALGFSFGLIALSNSNRVADIAADAARATAKAETATARANTAEIYAYQVYTELNRLGYPVKTPAENHEPQPPSTPPAEKEP